MNLKDYLASAISSIFSPYLITLPLVIFLSLKVSPTPLVAFKWIFIALIFVTFVPLFEILFSRARQARRAGRPASGRGLDLHLANREEREAPFMIASLSGFLGLFLLVILGAPKVLITLGFSFLFLGFWVTAITFFWKISAHTAGLSAVVMVTLLIFGPKFLPLFLLIPLVGWARTRRHKHTLAQVVAGAALAIVTVFLTFFIRELI